MSYEIKINILLHETETTEQLKDFQSSTITKFVMSITSTSNINSKDSSWIFDLFAFRFIFIFVHQKMWKIKEKKKTKKKKGFVKMKFMNLKLSLLTK